MKGLILIDSNKLTEIDKTLVDYILQLKIYDLKPFLDSADENYIRSKLKKYLKETDIQTVINKIFIEKNLVYFLESEYITDDTENLLTLVVNHPAMIIYYLDSNH